MPVMLEGSCRCGAIRFACDTHTPQPYQRCYCSICRKTAGGGGYAINLGANAGNLRVKDPRRVKRIYHATIQDDAGACELSTAERHHCSRCATALWLFSPEWPDLLHPFASAIDNSLPVAAASVHIMLQFKAHWVAPHIGPSDRVFDLYPDQSIEDWHRSRGLWVD